MSINYEQLCKCGAIIEDIIYNYIIKQLSEVPMILNRKLSYKNIKFNSKNEFDMLRLMIGSFLDEESEERYFVLPGIRDGLEKQQYYINDMNTS